MLLERIAAVDHVVAGLPLRLESGDDDRGPSSDWLQELLEAASPRWTLNELAAAKDKLRKIGAADGPRQLAALLEEGLNKRLRSCGLKAFTDDTSAALRSQLSQRYGLLRPKRREQVNVTDEAGAELPVLFTVLSEAQPQWTEKQLEAVEEKLAKAGVHDVRSLGECLLSNLNQRLRDCGEKTFMKDTISTLRKRFEEPDLQDYLKRSRNVAKKVAPKLPEEVLLPKVVAVDDAPLVAVHEKAGKRRGGKWTEALERKRRLDEDDDEGVNRDDEDDRVFKETQWRRESDFRRHLQNASTELIRNALLMNMLCGCQRCSVGAKKRDGKEECDGWLTPKLPKEDEKAEVEQVDEANAGGHAGGDEGVNDAIAAAAGEGGSQQQQNAARRLSHLQREENKQQLQREQAEVLRRRLLLVREERGHVAATAAVDSAGGVREEEGSGTGAVAADPPAAAEAGAEAAGATEAAMTPPQVQKCSRSNSHVVLPPEAVNWTRREWKLFLRASSMVCPSSSCPSRVSVVVPTTESRQMYHEQIWQIFNLQTWTDKELVVVETFRNKPSHVFAEEQRHDARLVHIGIQIEAGADDLSIGVKRNICTLLASGSYLAQFDDDDVYAPCYLTTMLQALVDCDSNAITLASWYVFDPHACKLGHLDPVELRRRKKFNKDKEHDFVMGFGFSYIYTRKTALNCPFTALNYKEDLHFYNTVRSHNRVRDLADIVFLNDSVGLCVHTLHTSSTSSTASDGDFYTEVPWLELVSLEVLKENSLLESSALLAPLLKEALGEEINPRASSRFIRGGTRKRAEMTLKVGTSAGAVDVKVPVGATCAEITEALEKRLRRAKSNALSSPCCDLFNPSHSSSSVVELQRKCRWPPRPELEGQDEEQLVCHPKQRSTASSPGRVGAAAERQEAEDPVAEGRKERVVVQTLESGETVGPHWAPWGGGQLWAVLPRDRPLVLTVADLPDYAISVQLRLPHNCGLQLREVRMALLDHCAGVQADAAVEGSTSAKARAKARIRAAGQLKLVILTAEGNFKDADEDLEVGDVRLVFASFLAELLGRRRGPPYLADELAGLCRRVHAAD